MSIFLVFVVTVETVSAHKHVGLPLTLVVAWSGIGLLSTFALALPAVVSRFTSLAAALAFARTILTASSAAIAVLAARSLTLALALIGGPICESGQAVYFHRSFCRASGLTGEPVCCPKCLLCLN